jgi:hypothetical protein
LDAEQFAWREIIARVFEGLDQERDVAPAWLTNPATGRILRLNYLFPQVGLAIRLEGLRSRAQKAPEDERERALRLEREAVRERLCAEHGVRLLRFDIYEEPQRIFRELASGLAWSMRQVAKSDKAPEEKVQLLEVLRRARARLEEIQRRVHTSRDLQPWADLWVDRAYLEARQQAGPPRGGPLPRYVLHMRVRHPDFGTGRVVALADDNGDQIVTVRFDSGEERQFLAHLVVDKLRPC